MITHTLDLDVVPFGQPPKVRLSGKDTNFTLIINVFASRGRFVIESGTTVTLRGVKPDGTPCNTRVSFNGSRVTINGSILGVDTRGTGVFELCLSHGGKELYTTNFYILVEPSPAERM